jgi:hypothetical protein
MWPETEVVVEQNVLLCDLTVLYISQQLQLHSAWVTAGLSQRFTDYTAIFRFPEHLLWK